MTPITDEMVEAAAAAYWFEVYGRHRKQPVKWPDDAYGGNLFRDGCRAALAAALAAQGQYPVTVPDGWQLMPSVITASMINAWAGATVMSSDPAKTESVFQKAWRRMLAAAPQLPAVDDGGEHDA